MKQEKAMVKRLKVNKIFFIVPFLFFVVVVVQLARLCLFDKIDGIDLKKFANNRNTVKTNLVAERGNIYTVDGDPLAQNINSYTLIAYLSEKRSDVNTIRHVVDKKETAKALAPLLNMDESKIYKMIMQEKLYQVEIKRGLTEIEKEKIDALGLKGIDYIKSTKRYYPNGDFLSYILGYVRKYDDKGMIGELGLEMFFNDNLSGEDGYLEYQKDLNGYQIPNTPEIRKEAIDGNDIYLTIDENIQMFVEQAIKEASEQYKTEWLLGVVADAKTGAILGVASTPSFDPNIVNIKSYLNPLVSYAIEPGSTMKIFTYMTALEAGTYRGQDTFKSGSIEIDDATINEYDKKDWGTITYDQGFLYSSNVGVSNIVNKFIDRNQLSTYFKSLGFGSKTGITLANESAGKIDFRYRTEVANAAFGQGITITPIQMIQALTAVSNNGKVVRPYLVDKIVDSKTKEVLFQAETEVVATVASQETVDYIKDLMYRVIYEPSGESTGQIFKIDNFDLIGKTGTAQYVDPKTGKYTYNKYQVIKSFAGIFPKDDPQIVFYIVGKRPLVAPSTFLAQPTKQIVTNIAKYLNLYSVAFEKEKQNEIYKMPNFINKKTTDISVLSPKTVIGNGDVIINQYPKAETNLNPTDRVFFVTNYDELELINLNNWSRKDVAVYCDLLKIKCNFIGSGYVYSQDINSGTNILDIEEINFNLNSKILKE